MDLTFTPQQQAFRAQLRAWFEEHRPAARLDPPYTARGFEQHMEWERMVIDAGYSAPGWPIEVGGMGLDMWDQLIYDEEYARSRVPERLNKMGLLHGGPTVLAHGTDEQIHRWIPGLLDCTDIWCQGFSEPGAGSDLAGLRTTGRIVGDEIVINGQKTWTSNGAIATRIFALVRTDPQAPKHRGISFVVFDLDLPGVEVRPMAQIHGQAGFAEVFLDDVVIPLDSVVGEVNDGWRIAGTSLRLERGTARGTQMKLIKSLGDTSQAVAASGADASLVDTLGSLRAWTYAYEQSTYALTDIVARGADDGAASSVNKLVWSEIQTAVHETYLAARGAEGEVVEEDAPNGELVGMQRDYWHARAGEIFAGTNEIQRNIIAEQKLGLPREPRA
jgi:alkylation response protein AidB-like acyl-CoA dehydrogenase